MALQNPKLIAAAPAGMLMVFDVPVLGGVDLCGEPLTRRRRRLGELRLQVPYRRVDVHPDGDELLRATLDVGLEGVVAKMNASTYRAGVRSRDWVKVKHHDTTAMHVVAARRKNGRLDAVLAAGVDEKPVAWLDNWAPDISRGELDVGIPPGDGIVWGDGPRIAVRHLITPGLR